jgi:hypothetical protein
MTACAVTDRLTEKLTTTPERAGREHLTRAESLLLNEKYNLAAREAHLALLDAGNASPADEALFTMVLLYSHPGNTSRDLAKSAEYLEQLTTFFPNSPWTVHAKIWRDLAREVERRRMTLKDTLAELEEQKKVATEASREASRLKRVSGEAFQEIERMKRNLTEMSAENQKLKKIVEQSKMIDIEIDEKKRQQAK